MSDLRDAARQALEALETVFMPHHPAVIALKAALAEEALQRLTDANQEIEAALEQEPVPKSTWQKLYEAAIDQRNKAVALNQELLEALKLIASAENSALDLAYCKGIARAAIRARGQA
jgi:hypothetical protein